MDNDKIDQHSDEIEVESEEKERGKKIEIDEDRLPSRAMAIHEHIRQDGEKELERDAMALLWSAIAAGLSMGASLLAKGIFHVELEGVPGSFLLENLGYTFGFIIVIMARQQLFTENTVTAVLPVMQKPTMSNVGLLMRLWGIVLLGNILGTGIAAWAFEYMPIFNEETRDAFVKIGMDVMKNTPSEMFANAIISGWLIATMVWMFPAAGAAKIVVIILMTWLIAWVTPPTSLSVRVEILYLVFNGNSRCICQNRHGCDEEHPQRDVCQRDYFRLADRHYGMDVSCSGCGKDCGDYIDDLAYCLGDTTHIVVGSC